MINPRLQIPRQELIEFCKRNPIRELALFGSAVRDDFDPERSDVDLLIEFDTAAKVGLFQLFDMETELCALFRRKVDLVSKRGLNKHIRDEVLRAREVIYAQ